MKAPVVLPPEHYQKKQFLLLPVSLQMLVPWDPVVPLEQQWLDHRGQLHVKIEEIDCECHNKERKASGHDIK